jgi:hypothetical protein
MPAADALRGLANFATVKAALTSSFHLHLHHLLAISHATRISRTRHSHRGHIAITTVVTLTVASQFHRPCASTNHKFVIMVCSLCSATLQFHLYRILATVLLSHRRADRRRAAMDVAMFRPSPSLFVCHRS